MDILFVSDVLYPYITGGVEATEYNDMVELSKKHKVSVISFGYSGNDAFKAHGINYIRVLHAGKGSLYTKSGSRSILSSLRFAMGLPSQMPVGEAAPDVIVANAFPYLHLPFLRRYCNRNGCKLVIDVAEVWDGAQWANYIGFPGRLGKMIADRTLRLGDAYIANSSSTAKGLKMLGIDSGAISVFSPFLDDKVISAANGTARKRRIVYAGRLNDFKRLDKWLDVFAKAKEKVNNAEGLIIGDGPWKGYLLERIVKMGLGGSVRVIPFYKDKKMLYKTIRESALLLQMSEREGLSAIVLESIALGTPVALPDYTPIPGEVRAMCIVADEKKLPVIVAKVLCGKMPQKARAAGKRLRPYYIKNVNAEFSEIFRKLGVV